MAGSLAKILETRLAGSLDFPFGIQIQNFQYVLQKSLVIHSQYAKVNAVVGVVV